MSSINVKGQFFALMQRFVINRRKTQTIAFFYFSFFQKYVKNEEIFVHDN